MNHRSSIIESSKFNSLVGIKITGYQVTAVIWQWRKRVVVKL